MVFFALTACLFLNFRDIGVLSIAKEVLFLQFVPSLLKLFNTAALGAAGCVVVVMLTLLFGRVYCSTICPLGTLQDVIGFAARKRQGRRRFQYSAPHTLLRYAVFALTVISLLLGSGFLLNLLDPFSTFGRIFSNLVRPVVLLVNNAAATLLNQVGVHFLYQVQWAVIAPLSAGVAVVFLFLITWLAAKHGRLYCNTGCPVGTLLGLFSRISLFQIDIDTDLCNGCRLCESVCKARCIDSRNKQVDISRCVACFNCFAVCRKNGLRFKRMGRRRLSGKTPELERRGFILNSAVWVLGIAGIADQTKQIIESRPTTIPVRVTSPTSPPGSSSIAHFTATCTACHLCVSACPSRVLVPSFLEFGLLGMMQPRMNYHTGYCNYDCTACMEVCPSGAILPIGLEKKKLTQLGVAKFIKENCVVYTDNTNCGACSEHCPTKAVQMVPYANPVNRRLVIPEVRAEICIGCGGCEHACPTKPYKAIYVDGHPVHKLARKPAEEIIDERVDDEEDFPF